MLKSELIKLRKLIKQAQKGQATFSTVYKKLDQIQGIVEDDSENSEDECSPANYIKPIKGLLDNYQQSLERIKMQKTRPSVSDKQNYSFAGQTPSRLVTANRNQYSSTRQLNPQQRSASSHTKSIRQLDAEIMQLTKEIRNTLR